MSSPKIYPLDLARSASNDVPHFKQELLLSGNEIGPSGRLVPVVETHLCGRQEEGILVSSHPLCMEKCFRTFLENTFLESRLFTSDQSLRKLQVPDLESEKDHTSVMISPIMASKEVHWSSCSGH